MTAFPEVPVPVPHIILCVCGGLSFLAMLVVPFMKDDPEAGIKVSEGRAGPEYDHCKPQDAPVEAPAFNDPAFLTA